MFNVFLTYVADFFMGVKTLAEKKRQGDRVAGIWYLGLSSFIFEAGKDVNRLFGLSCVFSNLMV